MGELPKPMMSACSHGIVLCAKNKYNTATRDMHLRRLADAAEYHQPVVAKHVCYASVDDFAVMSGHKYLGYAYDTD